MTIQWRPAGASGRAGDRPVGFTITVLTHVLAATPLAGLALDDGVRAVHRVAPARGQARRATVRQRRCRRACARKPEAL